MRKDKKTPAKPVMGLPMAHRFNEVIACDVGELSGRKFLMVVDQGTNYCQAA